MKTSNIFELYPNINPELLEQAYKLDNYLIEETSEHYEYVAIYFSSHGIYYPNENEILSETVLKKNRFEFYKNRVEKAGKHIFLRDVFKQFYAKGINSQLDCVDKVAEFLREQSGGKKIVTVGSSAGGYAAVLFGILLNAEVVYSISSIFDIVNLFQSQEEFKKYKIIYENVNYNPISKYFNITNLIDYHEKPIFYILPFYNVEDKGQYEFIKNKKNVYSFKIKSTEHGILFESLDALKGYINSLVWFSKTLSILFRPFKIRPKKLTDIYKFYRTVQNKVSKFLKKQN